MTGKHLLAAFAAASLALGACERAPTTASPDGPAFNSSTLSVSLLGPDKVPPNTPCTWYAIPDGGTPPYQYRWQHLYLAAAPYTSDDHVTWSFPDNHTPQLVKVTVRDAHGATAEAYLGLSVTRSAPPC